MKNIFTFALIIMVCMVNSAKAQSSAIAEAHPSNTPISSIVRAYSPSEIITYEYCQNNKSSFLYASLPFGTLQKNPLPNNMHLKINDFRVFGDYVFFCGERTSQNQSAGFVGYFYLSDLISGSTVTYKLYLFPYDIKTLYRLVVYDDDAPVARMVAIGTNIPATGQPQNDIILDCKDILGTPTFEMKNAIISTYSPEELCDICYTGRNVVIVSSYYDIATHTPHLCLRRCDPNSPLNNSIDTLHMFPEPRFVAWPELFAVALIDNNVAVSYRGEDLSSHHFYRLRVFDIGTSPITNINSQEMANPNKGYMHEMAFLENDKTIVQLEDFATTGGFTSNFIYFHPYAATGYTTDFMYDEIKRMYQSVTATDSWHFVGAGCLHWLYRDILGGLPAPSATPPPAFCPNNETAKISIIDRLAPTLLYNPQMPVTLYPQGPQVPHITSPEIISIICESVNK